MNRNAIIISLLATFLIGCSLGLMGGMLFTHLLATHEHWRPGMPPGHEGPWRFGGARGPGGPRVPGGAEGPGPQLGEALPRLEWALDLTPEQLARIQPKVLATRREFAAVRESLRIRIESELTPAQRERWRQMQHERGFPGEPRGPWGRAHRAPPGDEGEPR